MEIRHGLALLALGVCGCGDNSIVPRSGPSAAQPSFAPPAPPPVTTSDMDTHPVQLAAVAPPPISGGTLLVLHDGSAAVAADPDRDRVSIVSLADGTVRSMVQLEQGDEPGRV